MSFLRFSGDRILNSVYPDETSCLQDAGVEDTGVESKSEEIRSIFSLKYVAKLSASSLLLLAWDKGPISGCSRFPS